jgi:hypothetical protein
MPVSAPSGHRIEPRRTAAFLKLLSAAARTGLVAPDLGLWANVGVGVIVIDVFVFERLVV